MKKTRGRSNENEKQKKGFATVYSSWMCIMMLNCSDIMMIDFTSEEISKTKVRVDH